MQKFSESPVEMVASFWRNRGLILSLVFREIVGRYKGSVFGIFWSLLTPIFMLAVYTFVFSVVFKARWVGVDDGPRGEFALILFSGLLVFNIFAECINRASDLVLVNVNYVKKVVFPLEILPWLPMGSALFHFLIGFIVWLVAYCFLIGTPHWTIILSPMILTPFIFFVMGLCWVTSSLGVFFRDVGQFVGLMVQVLMFLSPIFYPATALPEEFQRLMFFNPMTPAIEMMRDVMVWGKLPSLELWLSGSAVSIFVAMLGFSWFQKTRKGFADVL